jgi:oxygen-dependent protoporphyrinogen oxidase
MRVAIVGGGITGLSAAYDLQKADGVEVTLLEQGPVIGGKIQTACEQDFLIEQGPDSIFSSKPWAIDLMRELRMEEDLMEPLAHSFSILTKGKLHPVPRALASLVPSAAGALEKVAFLSSSAKRRALREAEIESGSAEDESIASFFTRRFGKTFSHLVAEPLLAGTHAGDARRLSMAALYPAYLGMERSHGSIAQAVSSRAPANGSAKRPGFLTLKDGMASFPRRLAAALTQVDVRLGAPVLAVSRSGPALVVGTPTGDLEVDHLLVTTPAYAAAPLLAEVAPEASGQLGRIRYVSTAIATLAYPRDAFKETPSGNGFLVPFGEDCPISGCTWSSNKWAGRAPDDVLLVRAFMGRDGGLDIDFSSDEDLLRMATETLARLISPIAAPTFTRLDRWPKAMAQYEIGHLGLIAALDAALADLPISLAGSSYRGNSIPDCVRQGREAAGSILGG